ncbi:MAG: hypothetical protein ABJE10_17290 [bacterium]
MSAREVLLTDLVGRTVHDVNGRRVGRIEELCAGIELHEHGNEYVVRSFHLGAYGMLEAMAGSRFARAVFGRFIATRSYSIPWESMDLSDVEHPRLTHSIELLVTE